jgi:hypothetical protein
MPIKTGKNVLKLSDKLLGTEEAWLWVGSAYGPIDNDDARVKETRELMEKYYPYVPYGMWVGNKEGEKMIALKNKDGFYEVDLSWWPVGSYRINLHTNVGEESPYGSKLNPEKRDQDCSWAPIDSKQWGAEDNASLQPFLHTEENGAGTSVRILIRPDRGVEAFGDQTL